MTDQAYEQAKDRNEGKEPDSLHVEYERERIRLLAENDLLAAIVHQWSIGAPAARAVRQAQLRAWWPALGDILDTAAHRLRGSRGTPL